MAAGIKRSIFVSPLSRAIGIKRLQDFRILLNKNGMSAPYVDEVKAMKIAEAAGHSLRKYHPVTPEGVAYKGGPDGDTPSSSSTALVLHNKKPGRKPGPQKEKVSKAERLARLKETVRNRLSNRLMEMITTHKGTYRKNILVKIMEAGGYPEPWTDEVRAVGILRAAGIKVDKFVYLNDDATQPASVVLREEVADGAIDPGYHKWLVEQSKLIRLELESFDHHVVKAIQEGRLRSIVEPMEIAYSALREAQKGYKKK